ncbi:hypothetical protein [Spirillospora sp. CA-128828]|uniref:hypothetical protein n=1 Tax=Spirillospora sp. CA-128828 TaxID=3240033 RepID=UPI003D8D9D62
MTILSAAILAHGIMSGAISFPGGPAPEEVRSVSGRHEPVEISQTAGRPRFGPAQTPADVGRAVQELGRTTTVGLAAQSLLPSGNGSAKWDVSIRTTELPNPWKNVGGKLQFNRTTGRVSVSDTEEDGHLVRGGVAEDGVLVVRLRAGEQGKEDVATIPDYDKNKNYILKVCLAKSDVTSDMFCESIDSRPGAEPDRGKADPCGANIITAGSRDNCINGKGGIWGFEGKDKEYEKWKNAIRGPSLDKPPLPRGRPPSINDEPDMHLSKGHAKGASRVAEPAGIILRWLIWAVYGACVTGFVIIGAKMAIKHKRSEAGAHGAGLGWVAIACLVPVLAAAMIYLLIDPLGAKEPDKKKGCDMATGPARDICEEGK